VYVGAVVGDDGTQRAVVASGPGPLDEPHAEMINSKVIASLVGDMGASFGPSTSTRGRVAGQVAVVTSV